MVSESISVILPVHNVANQLYDCLRKLERRLPSITHGAFEVIVVDDGSTDRSLVVLDDMRIRFPFLHVVLHAQKLGVELAAGTGLTAASGDLIFIQESSRMIDLEHLQHLASLASDRGVLAARMELSDPKDEPDGSLQMISRVAMQSVAKSPVGSIKLVGETILPKTSRALGHVTRKAA